VSWEGDVSPENDGSPNQKILMGFAVPDERMGPMKKSKFSEEQIAFALREVEGGRPVAAVCRQLAIGEATFYIWKKKYGHLLRLGIFGGKYMTDCQEEFPRSWFIRAKLFVERHDAHLNCLGVNASQLLGVWRRSGWIHKQDPRGWFHWYCCYYMGRRTADDDRQIRPLACDRPTRGADSEALRTWGPRMSEAAATGRPSLGVRQPKDLGRV
jgi:transposase